MRAPVFERCSDITEADVAHAVSSADALRALLDHVAAVARPEEGAPKMLLAIARLATPQCTWLDGQLRVGIDGDDQQTRVSILVAAPGQTPRRLAPPTCLSVPFDEFTRAVRLAPRLIEPLQVLENGARIVLGSPEKRAQRPSSRPTRQAMMAIPPEAKRSRPDMPIVDPELHSKPTVDRMEAVRIEERAEVDVDDGWERE